MIGRILCRLGRHDWEIHQLVMTRTSDNTQWMIKTCRTCPAERWELIHE